MWEVASPALGFASSGPTTRLLGEHSSAYASGSGLQTQMNAAEYIIGDTGTGGFAAAAAAATAGAEQIIVALLQNQLAATENAAKQQKQEAEEMLIATKNAAQQQLVATKNAAQQQLNLLQRQLYEQKAIHHSADKLEEEVAAVCKQAKVST